MKLLRALALCLLVCPVHAQTSYGPMPDPKRQFLDQDGYPLAGGLVFTYSAGTTTPLATFTDSTGLTANPNPVVLDAGGFGSIYLAGGSQYRLVVQNAAGSTIWTADNVAAAITGNVSNFLPGGGNQSVQFNSTSTFAGDSSLVYNPGLKILSSFKFAGDGSCITGQDVLNAACYGVSPNNASNDTQLATAMAAAFNPNADGAAAPQHVLLPCGTLPFNNEIQIPALVKLHGCGRGDSRGLVPPLGRGTVLQANTGFNNGGGFGTDAVVGMGGIGGLSTEAFASGVEDLTIDANNVANGGLFLANCQEMCYVDHVQITNITAYGFRTWGANNNGNDATTNAPWGAAANFQGDANSGPYSNIEIFGYGGVTPSTVPLEFMNETGGRGLNGISIVMRGIDQNSGNTTPNVCALLWGQSFSLTNLHCEGPRDGFVFGPAGGAAYQYGDGADQVFVSNIQYSSPSNGCAVHLENVKGITITAARGPAGSTICDDHISYKGNDATYMSDYDSSNNFVGTIGILAGLNLDSPINTTNTITSNSSHAGGFLAAGPNPPCFTYQFIETSPYSYPFQSACLNTNGDIVNTVSGPAVTNGPSPLGDTYWQGPQTLAMGVGVAKEGLNMSAPLDTPNNVLVLLGNALSYNKQTQLFQVAYNGQSDANGFKFDLSGVSFVGSQTASAGTYTPAQVQAWQGARLNNVGTSVFGNAGVSGTVSTFTNSTGSCTIAPNAGVSCASDARLKQFVHPLDNALETVLALDPVTFQFKKGPHVTQAGFIAQAVQKLAPALVQKGADGYLTLNQTGLIPYLVGALQAEQDEIAVLKKQVHDLLSGVVATSNRKPPLR